MIFDALNRPVAVPAAPQRMVSLCPSVTETLYALGAGERVVGRTRFCIHPEPEVRAALRVGGTKAVDIERIASLNPDLIWCVKEENTPEMVAELAQHWPVYVFDVRTVEDGFAMIQTLGELIGCDPAPLLAEARSAVQQAADGCLLRHALRASFDSFALRTSTQDDSNAPAVPLAACSLPLAAPPAVSLAASSLYLIWHNPWYAVGADTYIHDVMRVLGWENAAAGLEGRYPEVSPEMLVALNPARVLLSSEPFPFGEKHVREIQALLPNATVQLCDGEAFSWYGARMRKLAEAVAKIMPQLP